ncbi:DinB family protein [Chloroflexota bacterium]
MSSIPEIITYLEFGRAELFKSIDGLSWREQTQIPVQEEWTVKDILAHIIGWDEYVLEILPLIIQNRAGEIEGVEPDEHNRRSVDAWRDKPLSEALATIKSTHQQIVDIVSALDHVEIDMRREWKGQTITIRSYIIDIQVEHERQHAMEIEQWRESLDSTINPKHIKQTLAQNRAEILATIEDLSEADVLDKTAVGDWSVKDAIGHLADWERRMLNSARHIDNPSLPAVPPVNDSEDYLGWNEVLAAQQESRAWPEVLVYLTETRQALDDFLATLERGDWKKRGPYPWSNDQGTLAELITWIAEHDTEHIPGLEEWHKQRAV